MRYKKSLGENTFDVCNYLFLLALLFITLYPVWYVVMASFSDELALYTSKGLLFWPKGFSIESYKLVFDYERLWIGYRNTIFYVAVGGTISVLLTLITAYCLTRPGLPGKNIFMMGILIPMYFGGRMISCFLVVKSVHMLDTVWAMLLPGAISSYNLILTINYFRGMPRELEEAAKIDGASEWKILFKVLIPLAKPIIAVITLYYCVGKWNTYMDALIYLRDQDLQPLQMVLRQILVQNDTAAATGGSASSDTAAFSEGVKYATVVVSTLPIMCVYPFIQKYFVKGVMIGAVKG